MLNVEHRPFGSIYFNYVTVIRKYKFFCSKTVCSPVQSVHRVPPLCWTDGTEWWWGGQTPLRPDSPRALSLWCLQRRSVH